MRRSTSIIAITTAVLALALAGACQKEEPKASSKAGPPPSAAATKPATPAKPAVPTAGDIKPAKPADGTTASAPGASGLTSPGWAAPPGTASSTPTAAGEGEALAAGGAAGATASAAPAASSAAGPAEELTDADVRAPTKEDLKAYTKGIKGKGRLVATISTSMGDFHCELFEDKAPMTVANFVGLARGLHAFKDPRTGKVFRGVGYYDGIIFHRVMPGFMIQGGDPLGVGRGGPGYKFADEFHPDLKNEPGTLAMANSGKATNGSQFFINEVDNGNLNNKHSVFGKCDEIDLVTKIANVPVTKTKPITPVTINTITFARVK
jgi:peptidyl-prolyl cis-trans isomerase A (cyclophilin A)